MNKSRMFLVLVSMVLLTASGCLGEDKILPAKLELISNAFEHETAVPGKYSCEGDDISPSLKWSAPPEGTVELALVCEDPDAPVGLWTHWIAYSIPPGIDSLAEALPTVDETEKGIMQGENSWGNIGYGGPCPPRGPAHRYFFKLYALNKLSGLQPGATRAMLEKALEGHIIGYGELMGTFKR